MANKTNPSLQDLGHWRRKHLTASFTLFIQQCKHNEMQGHKFVIAQDYRQTVMSPVRDSSCMGADGLVAKTDHSFSIAMHKDLVLLPVHDSSCMGTGVMSIWGQPPPRVKQVDGGSEVAIARVCGHDAKLIPEDVRNSHICNAKKSQTCKGGLRRPLS